MRLTSNSNAIGMATFASDRRATIQTHVATIHRYRLAVAFDAAHFVVSTVERESSLVVIERGSAPSADYMARLTFLLSGALHELATMYVFMTLMTKCGGLEEVRC